MYGMHDMPRSQRLVGARVLVSQSSDYHATNAQSCGSVTARESSLGGTQDLM